MAGVAAAATAARPGKDGLPRLARRMISRAVSPRPRPVRMTPCECRERAARPGAGGHRRRRRDRLQHGLSPRPSRHQRRGPARAGDPHLRHDLARGRAGHPAPLHLQPHAVGHVLGSPVRAARGRDRSIPRLPHAGVHHRGRQRRALGGGTPGCLDGDHGGGEDPHPGPGRVEGVLAAHPDRRSGGCPAGGARRPALAGGRDHGAGEGGAGSRRQLPRGRDGDRSGYPRRPDHRGPGPTGATSRPRRWCWRPACGPASWRRPSA